MKKISKVLKGERRSNSVNLLQDGAELPYGEKLNRKRPAGRGPKSSYPSSSADSGAEQPTSE